MLLRMLCCSILQLEAHNVLGFIFKILKCKIVGTNLSDVQVANLSMLI